MLTLQAKNRNILGKKNQTLREKGLIPAVIYGRQIKNQNLKLDAREFAKLFEQAGETSLIDLEIEDQKPVKVIVQDIQRDTLKGDITHIDFHQIREDEKLTVDVELEFIGKSKVVEEQGGVLVKSLDAIKIECLPADLIHKIEVDISSLKEFGDVIYVKDLDIPGKVKVLENPDEAVVSVTEPRSEKELEELEEKPEEGELPEGAEEEAAEGEEKKDAEAKEEGEKPEVKSEEKTEEESKEKEKK